MEEEPILKNGGREGTNSISYNCKNSKIRIELPIGATSASNNFEDDFDNI
jgi:hypothetical protein